MEIGHRLQADWSAYLKVRDEVLASILEGSTKEAVDLDLQGGVPSFDRVRRDLDSIKRVYDERAVRQLAIADASSRQSIYKLITVLTLTIVFACISIWLVQRSRLGAALQLARLQMDFVASISHELRTPLSVIRSAAENICDGVVDDAEQLARYGSTIRNQTRQVTDLVNEILLFASSRQRKQGYVLTRVDVPAIIDAVVENTSELLEGEGFVLERDVDAALPEVVADAAALIQCLQNLVVNAIKYSGHSRWIGIYADHRRGEDSVRISVHDRGIGIASSELKRIFEPFYRSPSVSAAQIHGTGLGLALARNIAEAMAGDLTVESALGQGSVFTIHIPIVAEFRTRVSAKALSSHVADGNK
jgi:signal transduction histidine kinase